jgi:hypothetical protein
VVIATGGVRSQTVRGLVSAKKVKMRAQRASQEPSDRDAAAQYSSASSSSGSAATAAFAVKVLLIASAVFNLTMWMYFHINGGQWSVLRKLDPQQFSPLAQAHLVLWSCAYIAVAASPDLSASRGMLLVFAIQKSYNGFLFYKWHTSFPIMKLWTVYEQAEGVEVLKYAVPFYMSVYGFIEAICVLQLLIAYNSRLTDSTNAPTDRAAKKDEAKTE